jgi:hypothetical protein
MYGLDATLGPQVETESLAVGQLRANFGQNDHKQDSLLIALRVPAGQALGVLGNALWAALYAGNFGILILALQMGQCQNEADRTP